VRSRPRVGGLGDWIWPKSDQALKAYLVLIPAKAGIQKPC
jgi:hypothetical protein